MRMTREFYRPSPVLGAIMETSDDVPGSEIYRYTNRRGQPVAQVFGGKRAKPDWHFSFMNEERREARIAEWIEGQKGWAASRVAARKERYEPHSFKIGDVFYASWGYDQTQVDFFKIVELKGKTMAKIVPIGAKTISSNPPQEMVVANPDHIRDWDVLLNVNTEDEDKGKWKRLTKNGFTVSHTHASPDSGDPHYETSWGWGH